MQDKPYPGMGNVSKAEGLYLQEEEKQEDNDIAIITRRPPYAKIPFDLIRDSSIIRPARFLYAMYDSFADNKLHFTFTGQERIAKALGLKSVVTVSRLTTILKEAGWITVIKRGLGKPNIIILHQSKNEVITKEEIKAYKAETEKRIRERYRYSY